MYRVCVKLSTKLPKKKKNNWAEEELLGKTLPKQKHSVFLCNCAVEITPCRCVITVMSTSDGWIITPPSVALSRRCCCPEECSIWLNVVYQTQKHIPAFGFDCARRPTWPSWNGFGLTGNYQAAAFVSEHRCKPMMQTDHTVVFIVFITFKLGVLACHSVFSIAFTAGQGGVTTAWK